MKKLQRIRSSHMLFAGLLLLIITSYLFGFKRTFDLWQINRQLKMQVAQSNDLIYQPEYLNRKKNNLDKIISRYRADTAAFRNVIINSIALIAERENVKLSTVPTWDDSFRAGKFNIELLTFEGNYFSLIKMINVLQSTRGIGVIRSENWKVVTSNKSDTAKQLVVELYFEIAK